MNNKQSQELIDLLWDSLPRDAEHKDRRHTGWGTKTKEGLAACIERIVATHEMLKVCKDLVAAVGNPPIGEHEIRYIADQARAAIAKALA